MSILNRKPIKYSTSDLIWAPSPAPTDGMVGDFNTLRLDPSHLAYAQDVLISKDGTLRSRGAIKNIGAQPSGTPLSLVQCGGNSALITISSANSNQLLGISGSALGAASTLAVFGEDGISTTNKVSFVANMYKWQSLKLKETMALGAGTVLTGALFCGGLIQTGNLNYVSSTLWSGSLLTSNTSTGTFSVTLGSTAVTGVGTSWTTALLGAYLMDATGRLYGQVKTIVSTTSITLVEPAYLTAAAVTPVFKAARMLQHLVYKGRITCTTTSTSVVGVNTKFNTSAGHKTSSTGVNVGAYNLFRLSDGTYIGTVASVQNDTTLTLGGVAAINMSNEEYVLRPASGFYVNGYCFSYFGAASVESYADRYWYGGIVACDSDGVPIASHDPLDWSTTQLPSSICFTRKNSPELMDISSLTGDVITLPTTGGSGEEIRGLKATRGGMLIFRGVDTYYLTGYSPETFRVIKIVDDGALGQNCFQRYKEGVIWAGYKSFWYFDGTKVIDLLENKVKGFWQTLAITLSGNDVGSAFAYDHFMLSLTTSSLPTVPYQNATDTCINMTFVLNMTNGAVSFFTNLFVYNSLDYAYNNNTQPILLTGFGAASTSVASGWYVAASTIFQESTASADNIDLSFYNENFQGHTNVRGPKVMFETVKYSLGDASRMKFFKMLLMNYSSDKAMNVLISGTNQSAPFPNVSGGTVSATTFPINSGTSILKRVKFLIRAPQLFIRIYTTDPTVGISQKFKLFWYTVGGKKMRIGRSQ